MMINIYLNKANEPKSTRCYYVMYTTRGFKNADVNKRITSSTESAAIIIHLASVLK